MARKVHTRHKSSWVLPGKPGGFEHCHAPHLPCPSCCDPVLLDNGQVLSSIKCHVNLKPPVPLPTQLHTHCTLTWGHSVVTTDEDDVSKYYESVHLYVL